MVALIGTVGKQHRWRIIDGAPFSSPAVVRLLCCFNDVQAEAFYRNNSGWVVLEAEVL